VFPPGGALMAIQRPDQSIAIVRTDTWKSQADVKGEPAFAPRLAFSPDDRLVAAVDMDGVLRVWDAGDGTAVAPDR
jgi:WD40 repeat protein